jgi:hypothetical protein
MADPEAARTVFDQKAGSSGRQRPDGHDARREAHDLNFRHGRHQESLSGYAAEPENVAAMVDKRLPGG